MKTHGSSATTLLKVGIYAGIIGGLGWMAKMVIMASRGGPDSSSMSEAFAFFAGLLGVVVATAAFGAYVTREKSRIRQALTALCAVAAVAAVIALAQTVLPTAFGQGWVQEEIIFGIIGAGYAIGATRAILTHMAFGTPIAH